MERCSQWANNRLQQENTMKCKQNEGKDDVMMMMKVEKRYIQKCIRSVWICSAYRYNVCMCVSVFRCSSCWRTAFFLISESLRSLSLSLSLPDRSFSQILPLSAIITRFFSPFNAFNKTLVRKKAEISLFSCCFFPLLSEFSSVVLLSLFTLSFTLWLFHVHVCMSVWVCRLSCVLLLCFFIQFLLFCLNRKRVWDASECVCSFYLLVVRRKRAFRLRIV